MSSRCTDQATGEPELIGSLRGETVDFTPVWFMRQAGRFNPRHRDLYEQHGVRGITTTPELNARVTTMPVEDFGVDAAVMYADIMLPLQDMGIEFHYGKGDTGPIMETDVSEPADIENLRVLEPERGVPYILEAVRRVKDELVQTPVIGFSGGPFTLSAYVLEGEASRTFQRTKTFMYEYPDAYRKFMEKLSASIIRYLNAKIEAGIDVVQLFESWMGALSPQTYREFVHPHVRAIYDTLNESDCPSIHFGTNTAGMLDDQVQSGAEAIGVDWRVSLETVAHRAGTRTPIMGNLDPAMVFASDKVLESEISSILSQGRQFPGHVFNLGHRVPNDAGVDRLKKIVDLVHQLSSESPRSHPAS